MAAALTKSNLVREVTSNAFHFRVEPETTTEGFIYQPLETTGECFILLAEQSWADIGFFTLTPNPKGGEYFFIALCIYKTFWLMVLQLEWEVVKTLSKLNC